MFVNRSGMEDKMLLDWAAGLKGLLCNHPMGFIFNLLKHRDILFAKSFLTALENGRRLDWASWWSAVHWLCIPLRAFFFGSADSPIFLKEGHNDPIHPYDVWKICLPVTGQLLFSPGKLQRRDMLPCLQAGHKSISRPVRRSIFSRVVSCKKTCTSMYFPIRRRMRRTDFFLHILARKP